MKETDFQLIKRLSDAFGPTGYEDEVRDLILQEIRPFADEVRIDGMGNLIAVKGKDPEILYAAHMDEVGFMITGFTDDGTLRFSSVGGVMPGMLASKRVLVGEKRIPGVICATPIHLSGKEKKELSFEDLRIHIGASGKEEAQKLVALGDGAIFDTACCLTGAEQSCVAGKALDNRLGCYLLIRLIRDPKIQSGIFVFTVQEETGVRGATAAAEAETFRYGIALDTTTAGDTPGVVGLDRVCRLGAGGVLSFQDGATVYDNALISELFARLEEKKIPVQTKTKKSGGNDASAIQKAGIGHSAISLSTPARYLHGPCALALVSDIEAMESALVEIHRALSERSRA